jgi:hypothetical protein
MHWRAAGEVERSLPLYVQAAAEAARSAAYPEQWASLRAVLEQLDAVPERVRSGYLTKASAKSAKPRSRSPRIEAAQPEVISADTNDESAAGAG